MVNTSIDDKLLIARCALCGLYQESDLGVRLREINKRPRNECAGCGESLLRSREPTVYELMEMLRAKAAVLNLEICALADEIVDKSLTVGHLQCLLDDARIHSCWLHRDLREARDAARKVETGGERA